MSDIGLKDRNIESLLRHVKFHIQVSLSELSHFKVNKV